MGFDVLLHTENNNILTIMFIDKRRECWKQGKDDLLLSKYYLRNARAKYYRTKPFKLDITKIYWEIWVSDVMLMNIVDALQTVIILSAV